MRKRLATSIGECAAVEGVGVSFVEDREGGGTDSEVEEGDDGEDELGLTKEAEVQAQR